MKKQIILASIFCLSMITVFSQSIPDSTSNKSSVPPPPALGSPEIVDDEKAVFTKVENEAYFPGGQKAWVEFLTSKLGSFEPAKNGAPKGKYQVIARFIVSKTGKISDASSETNHGYGMEKAVLKMIKESPNWLPAIQNGRPVNAYRRQPVTFVVE